MNCNSCTNCAPGFMFCKKKHIQLYYGPVIYGIRRNCPDFVRGDYHE